MRRQSHLARPRVASRVSIGFVVLVASSLASACVVSFDGYELRGNGGTDTGNGGDAASSGKPGGGSKSDGGRSGASAAGSPNGSAGDPESGAAGDGGSGAAGAAGSSSGGGGTPTAGSGGNGGTSGGGGSAGNAGSGGSAGSGGGGGAKNCPVNLQRPPLIEIPKAGGGFYCMDRTEVTNEEYSLFLASSPGTANQVAACGFNTSFVPDTSAACAAEEVAKYDPVARPNVPVGCVDWCDAKRYCEWAGKRLCGAIGGGSNPPGSFADANASQ